MWLAGIPCGYMVGRYDVAVDMVEGYISRIRIWMVDIVAEYVW